MFPMQKWRVPTTLGVRETVGLWYTIRLKKPIRENGFVQISISQILDMQSLPSETPYCRQVGFFIGVLVAFLLLSELCLLHAVSASPGKVFPDWKIINFWKKLFHMQRTRNVFRLFCFRMVFSFPPKEKYPRPPLSGPTYFFLIKVLSYSVLSMHHFREYLNSSVPVA